jgi:hypothetical protein
MKFLESVTPGWRICLHRCFPVAFIDKMDKGVLLMNKEMPQ